MKQKKRLHATCNLRPLLELVPHFESVDLSNAVGIALRDVIGPSIAVELGHDVGPAAQAEAIKNLVRALHTHDRSSRSY
jgi:hypothetical protein